jgi:predicted GNAT family N-acyltransferase
MDASISMNEFEVLQVSWLDMESHLRSIRTLVFIEEQNVPIELEWEEEDVDCVHLLVKKDNNYIATARLLDTGQIGRMAVLKPYRQCGIGSAMLKKFLSIAKAMDMESVFLNAQVDAIKFYEKFGFLKHGVPFDDAGIPHVRMDKVL